MPPLCAEVDVFRVPHHRMKSLVHRSLRSYAETDFSDVLAAQMLLIKLESLLDEIRKHEAIEDSFIMKKLFERVEQLPGPRPSCWPELKSEHTCVLPKISELVSKIGEALGTRHDEGLDVQTIIGATYYVVLSLYLDHIVEEEGTVMSLLLEYFDSAELVALKQLVLDEHAREMMDFYEESKSNECDSGVDTAEEIDVDMHTAGGLPFKNCDEAWACLEASLGDIRPASLRPAVGSVRKPRLPAPKLDELPELALDKILSYLLPQDRVSCASASDQLAIAATAPYFWQELDASQFDASSLLAVFHVILPRAGAAIKKIIFRECDGLHSGLFSTLLAKTPSVEEVDFSFSPAVADECFQWLAPRSLRKLRSLDLTGCTGVTDYGLRLLAHHLRYPQHLARRLVKAGGGLRYLSLSGCCRITSLDDLFEAKFARQYLAHLDLSGCFLLPGDSIRRFVQHCPNLKPENLFYCSCIQDGPYPGEANGCANLEDNRRFCCMMRSSQFGF